MIGWIAKAGAMEQGKGPQLLDDGEKKQSNSLPCDQNMTYDDER